MLHHVRLASTASRVDALAFGGGAGPHGLGGPHASLAVASSHLSHNRWRGDLALYRAPALAEAAGDALQRAARPPLRLCGMQTCGGTTGVAWLRHGGPGAAALVAAGDSGDLTVWRVMRGADDMHDGLGDDGLGGNDPHSAAGAYGGGSMASVLKHATRPTTHDYEGELCRIFVFYCMAGGGGYVGHGAGAVEHLTAHAFVRPVSLSFQCFFKCFARLLCICDMHLLCCLLAFAASGLVPVIYQN